MNTEEFDDTQVTDKIDPVTLTKVIQNRQNEKSGDIVKKINQIDNLRIEGSAGVFSELSDNETAIRVYRHAIAMAKKLEIASRSLYDNMEQLKWDAAEDSMLDVRLLIRDLDVSLMPGPTK